MNDIPEAVAATCKIVAPSMRQALRLVRERLGPDAIILSITVIATGVEIDAIQEGSEAGITDAAEVHPDQDKPALPELTAQLAQPLDAGICNVSASDNLLHEFQSLRGMIEEDLASLMWNDMQGNDPILASLLRTLTAAGFSTELSRNVLQTLKAGQSFASGMAYAKAELTRRIPMLEDEDEDELMDEGGVYALMGPTGVGKTTTTAKLAARCVKRFGAEKLALVTTDCYRIGAYEQLQMYGQILGIEVYAVRDAVDLDSVLNKLRDKHMVLVDTVGMSQRDHAVPQQIAMLCGATRPVKRLLLLNASSHSDALDEVVLAYRQGAQPGHPNDLAGCIFTKVDEATHPGTLIDIAIRHRLKIHYISGGQKVPEHLILPDRHVLLEGFFQSRTRPRRLLPVDIDVGQRPAPLVNDVEIAAAHAVSERLRLQCSEMIRSMVHSASEVAVHAVELTHG